MPRKSCSHRVTSTLLLVATAALQSYAPVPAMQEQATKPAQVPALKAAKPRVQAIPDAITQLLSRREQALIHIKSPAELLRKISKLVAIFEPKLAAAMDLQPSDGNPFDLSQIYEGLGIDPSDFDFERSLAFGCRFTFEGPRGVLVLPAKKALAFKSARGDASTVSGDYVGVGIGGAIPKINHKPLPLTQNLASGDVNVRLNLKKLLRPFRATIKPYLDVDTLFEMMRDDMAVEEDETVASKYMLGLMLDGVKLLLDHGETFDLTLSLEEGALALDLSLDLAKHSAVAADKNKSGRSLPWRAGLIPMDNPPFVTLAHVDWMAFVSFVEEMEKTEILKATKEKAALLRRSQLADRALFMPLSGPSVMAFELGKKGFQGIAFVKARNPKKLKAEFDATMKLNFEVSAEQLKDVSSEFPGITVEYEKARVIDGVKFHSMKMAIDLKRLGADLLQMGAWDLAVLMTLSETLFGKDGLTFAYAAIGDYSVILVGDIDSLAKSCVKAFEKNQRRPIARIDELAASLPGNPSYLFSTELRSLLRPVINRMSKATQGRVPMLEDGKPIRASFACGRKAQRYWLHMRVDLEGLMTMIKKLSSR